MTTFVKNSLTILKLPEVFRGKMNYIELEFAFRE